MYLIAACKFSVRAELLRGDPGVPSSAHSPLSPSRDQFHYTKVELIVKEYSLMGHKMISLLGGPTCFPIGPFLTRGRCLMNVSRVCLSSAWPKDFSAAPSTQPSPSRILSAWSLGLQHHLDLHHTLSPQP